MRISGLISIFKNYTLLKGVNKIFTRQTSKSLVGDKFTPLTENTLLGRMLLYLNNSVTTNQEELLKSNGSNIIDSLVHGRTSGLRNLNVEQIAGLFYTANTSILSQNKQNLRRVLDLLDVECCLRVNSMDPQSILKLLNAFMHVVPNRITEYKFYQSATDNIDRCLRDVSRQELLQFIFYIGLHKKAKKAQVVLRKCLRNINREFLDSLTVEDLCIICNSAYRTNTKITSSHLLEKVRRTLNENLSLLKDPAFLITLLKTIKHNHYEDEDLLSTISCTIFFNNTSKYYTFTAICHILSLYAGYLYYDEELLNLLSKRGIEQLQASSDIKSKSIYLSEQPRAKDITTFLWALSILGYTEIDQEVLRQVIVPKIKERIAGGEYKKNPEELVNCILYMWMLNYRAKELMSYGLSQKNVAAVREHQPKSRLRLNLLLATIELEDPFLFRTLRIKPMGISGFNPSPQIQSRPLLQKVFRVAKSVASRLDIHQVKMNCQIPYLNIVGISGYRDQMIKAVNIEVLDEYTCVKNQECRPCGFMSLKLRILDQSEVPLITVSQSEVGSLSDLELEKYLEDEIKLFC